MNAQWFIGAKNATGQVVIATLIEASDFEDAYAALTVRMMEERDEHGELVPTAVNEWPALCASGSELEYVASRDGALAGGSR